MAKQSAATIFSNLVAAANTAVKTEAPVKLTAPVVISENGAPLPALTPNRGTTVKHGTVSAAVGITVIDGWAVNFKAGTLDESLLKQSILKESKNPWYGLVAGMAHGPVGYVVLERPEGVTAKAMKAPTAAIKRARYQALDRNVKAIHKVQVTAGTVKGQWFLYKTA